MNQTPVTKEQLKFIDLLLMSRELSSLLWELEDGIAEFSDQAFDYLQARCPDLV